VKRSFGNWVSRLLWRGTVLSPLEYELLVALVEALPVPMREIVVAQIQSYNLVQREADGRALNFYRKKRGDVTDMKGIPLLDSTRAEAPLVRLSAVVAGDPEPIHAVLTAVNGRAFCVTLSRSVHDRAVRGPIEVIRIEQAWRSDIRASWMPANNWMENSSTRLPAKNRGKRF